MDKKNKSNVFLTGASGFIGANVIRLLLKKKYNIHILNRSRKLPWRLKEIAHLLTVHLGDVTDIDTVRNALKIAEPNFIIHLAAYGSYHYQTDLEKIINTNITGTKNILEASKDIPYARFVNTGSSSEYGYSNKPMKENIFCNPISNYAMAKLAQTHMCKIFALENNKPIITLRLFSIYGPYEEPTRFIPTIIKALIQNTTIALTPGKQRRDFVYVEDIARAYLQAMTFKMYLNGEIYNLGTGVEYANDEIVNTLFTVTNKKTVVQKGAYPKRTWDTSHWLADTTKTKKNLGWQPKHTTEEGIQKTYRWFTKNLNFYN